MRKRGHPHVVIQPGWRVPQKSWKMLEAYDDYDVESVLKLCSFRTKIAKYDHVFCVCLPAGAVLGWWSTWITSPRRRGLRCRSSIAGVPAGHGPPGSDEAESRRGGLAKQRSRFQMHPAWFNMMLHQSVFFFLFIMIFKPSLINIDQHWLTSKHPIIDYPLLFDCYLEGGHSPIGLEQFIASGHGDDVRNGVLGQLPHARAGALHGLSQGPWASASVTVELPASSVLMRVKQRHKPPIWEWFIPPIYGDLGDGLLLFYHFTHISSFFLNWTSINFHKLWNSAHFQHLL